MSEELLPITQSCKVSQAGVDPRRHWDFRRILRVNRRVSMFTRFQIYQLAVDCPDLEEVTFA